MSMNLYNELYEKIENGVLNLHFDYEKEIFLDKLEYLREDNELTEEEHLNLLDLVEDVTCGISNFDWEDMKLCDPNLED